MAGKVAEMTEEQLAEHVESFLREFHEARTLAMGWTGAGGEGQDRVKYYQSTMRQCFRHYDALWALKDLDVIYSVAHRAGFRDPRMLQNELRIISERGADMRKEAQNA